MYKQVVRGLEELNMVQGQQAPPSGFIAIALLLQICQNVNVYGIDPPERVPFSEDRPYRYFDNRMPDDINALAAEHMLLRTLHAGRYITLCTTEHVNRCVGMTPRNANGVILRAGINW